MNEHDNVSDNHIEGVINSVIQDNLVDDSAKDNLVDDNKVDPIVEEVVCEDVVGSSDDEVEEGKRVVPDKEYVESTPVQQVIVLFDVGSTSASFFRSQFSEDSIKICAFAELVDSMPPEVNKRNFNQLYHTGFNARNKKKKWTTGAEVISPHFDFKVDYVDSKYWFHDIRTPAQYLSGSHMDITFYHLRKKYRRYPQERFISCLPLDSIFDYFIREL